MERLAALGDEGPLRPARLTSSISQRLAVHVHRRDTLGWLVLLSLGLHLALFLSLLMAPTTQLPAIAAEPLVMDFIAEEGPTGTAPEPPAPAEATAAPPASSAPVQQAETPPPTPAFTPAPDVSPPPVQNAEISPPPPAPAPDNPPPLPVQQAEIPPVLDVPPPPVHKVEPLPPTPAPSPMPAPPLPRPVARARPPPAPPQRAVSRTTTTAASLNPAGAPAPATTNGQNATSRASNGAAWMGKLKQWWDQHSFYPKEASQTNEGGAVRVHIAIASDGQVTSIEVVQGSGSSVLDAAAVAVFRNARLPPFPPGTPAQPADVVVTLHYRSADSGG